MDDVISQSAGALFDSGFRCAESVLLAVAEGKGIQSDFIPRIATGFCGGISRTGNICGAVAGAVMAINLFYGRMDPSIPIEENYAKVQELVQRFDAMYGTTSCKALIGCDLSTAEGRAYFKDNNLLDRCRQITVQATQMAMEIIEPTF